MLIYLATFACAALLAWRIYRYDRFEPEPWFMVLLALGLGFGAMLIVGAAEDVLLRRLRLAPDAFAAKAAVVAVLEDAAKLLVVVLIARVFRRQFNDPMDGIIYGTLAGLGTAVEETLLYLSLAPMTLPTLGAELTRLLAHSLMGGVAGFAVGIGARPDRTRVTRPALVAACMLVSMTVHFAWDYVAYQRGAASLASRVGPMLLMLGLMLVWGRLLTLAARQSGNVFAPGAGAPGANGLIPCAA
jgi:RsiW-degrading membrane proteinase PrsW (M82 family)